MKLLLLLLFLTAPLMAQIQLIEKFSDGTILISLDGTTYRGLNADKMREVQKVKVERDEYKKESEGLATKIEELYKVYEKKEQTLKDKCNIELQKERKQTEFWKAEYERQDYLITLYQKRKCSKSMFGFRICWGA